MEFLRILPAHASPRNPTQRGGSRFLPGAERDRAYLDDRLLGAHRPVSHYFHNGLVQHTNATQASRGIEILYALLGDFDAPGGNVPGVSPRVNDVSARDALPKDMALRRLGRTERPIGPAVVPGTVTAYDLYRAILEGEPYRVRAIVSFGANMLMGIARRPVGPGGLA